MNSKFSKTLYFNLDISHEEILCYYKGIVNQVIVTAADNTKIQFPVQFIKKYVEHNGVHGRFKIVYDENNKLVSLDKLTG